MRPFLSVEILIRDVINAGVDRWLESWDSPLVVCLNFSDWEEIRLFLPGFGVCSNMLFGIPVVTDLAVKAGAFFFVD